MPELLQLYYLSEWIIRLLMIPIVIRRRRPTSALAWLVIIFFLPWFGLLLYLLIGRSRLPYRRTRRHARLLQRLQSLRQRFENHPHIVRPELSPTVAPAVTLAERLGYMPILGGNDAQLIAQPDTVIDRLIADIDAAHHHVHLLFYIYADDATGRRVADALARAVARGVTCRLLVDAVGSRFMLKTLADKMKQSGVEVCQSLPVGLFRRRMARLDLRNHRKLAVIDGHIAYAGSLNIIDSRSPHKGIIWHDLMVRIVGPVTLELQTVFVADWYFATEDILKAPDIFPEPSHTGVIPVQTLPSGPNYPTENYQRMVVAALHAAQHRVTITTPYFVPDEVFIQAMETAVLRGARVELIVPHHSDMILIDFASRAYYEELFDIGVKIYLHNDGLLHTKAMTIDDDIAFIGSSNFDIRSFALDFEINLVFYGPHLARQLRSQQNEYITQSQLLVPRQWRRRSRSRKTLQNLAKILSPLL